MGNRSKTDRQYNILYKTTNTINSKFYIGVHSTDDLEDGYLGSGYNITRAIKKYGKEHFTREILGIYECSDMMFLAEAEIVTTELIKSKDVYNIIPGGHGGHNKGSKDLKHMHDPITGERCAVHISAVDKMIANGWVLGRNMSSTTGTIWIHKDEKKQMIKPELLNEYMNNGWLVGLPKSPTLGKVWIYNPNTEKYSLCEAVDLEYELTNGWIKKKWAPIKKNSKQKIVTCPHCSKSGGISAIKRYHFDKCSVNIKD
jgi:hypothetical protein